MDVSNVTKTEWCRQFASGKSQPSTVPDKNLKLSFLNNGAPIVDIPRLKSKRIYQYIWGEKEEEKESNSEKKKIQKINWITGFQISQS